METKKKTAWIVWEWSDNPPVFMGLFSTREKAIAYMEKEEGSPVKVNELGTNCCGDFSAEEVDID